MDFTDDSMGESFGAGLDNSAFDLSGLDSLNLDFAGEVPVQGSDLSLDFSDGSTYAGGVADLSQNPDFWDDTSLSGVTDPAPSWDATGDNLNGSGAARGSYHDVSWSHDTSSVSDLFSAMTKFGSNIGAMLTAQTPAASRASVGHVPTNVNPNRSTVGLTSISGSHATLLVGVVVVLVGVVLLGGSR